MNRGTSTTYQQENVARMQSDAGYLNHVAMTNFGMDAKTLESVLQVMMSVSQGRMPDAKPMEAIYRMAQEKYGWGRDRVQAEMKTAIAQPSPQERLGAYLSANNKERVDLGVYNKAVELVQHGLRGDLEASIYNRLNDSKSVNAADRRFEGMEADKRVVEDTKDRQSMRQMLESLSGHSSAQTFDDRVKRVLDARSKLADRIEVQSQQRAAGHEPSLRESLRNTYDEKAVAAASEDVGLGNPFEEARREVDSRSSHMSEDADITENL